ncbi:calcium/proton exchanger [Nocardioides sp. Kera G14]|uniref:calcium/proton exchanger n=1 Tax=Nocardioides sp. Kera G14 TaxID=2884264 RepID=UPI001D107D16|nr:calcium/proton exchanger [Nocardioides sp. Kera G14]UDY24379.1 calcium/proton exchanger [Nocardioides sp. Kera G14]
MTTAAPEQHSGPTFIRSDLILLGVGGLAVLLAGLSHYLDWGDAVSFLLSAVAVTVLASLVGRSVDQLGDRFGPGATGVLQSALGNLPELFISLFALKAGLVDVVQAALIGSILANLLLVMGIAFVAGGVRHGSQVIDSARARSISVMLLVSVVAMVFPSITKLVHTPAAGHETALSTIASAVLIVLFILTLPASLKRQGEAQEKPAHEAEAPRWPVSVAVGMLALAGLLSAFVSDWFVDALQPAMDSWGISDAFAGLVIVAIAGNAIENVVGVQLALKNQSDYAFQLIINSPLQIALVLAPVLVILSNILGFTALTLVFSPMLVLAVFLAVLIAVVITVDGESNWMEGAALIGVYIVVAASFWWG